MATYTEMIIATLKAAGWDAFCRRVHGDRYVATAKKAGHICAAQDDGELGALTKLQQSVREVEAGKLFTPGQVIRLREHLGDVPPGHYLVRAVHEDGLALSQLGEEAKHGDIVETDRTFHLPMTLAAKVVRTGLRVESGT